jgi:hypothetical protein
MINILYKQACIRKKKSSINGRYFYLRSHVGLPFVAGNFKIICHGRGRTYGKGLLKWWLNGDYSIEYAELCAKYLKPRIKEIPQFDLEKLRLPQPADTDAVLGGDAAFQKWLSTAAVFGSWRKKTPNL